MAERNSERIQRDIERTRADMSETIDALERRLSPGELVDQLWGRVWDGETTANVGQTIRDHPVPLALMGLGLGWLAIEKSTQSRTDQLRARHGYSGEGTYARAEGRVGPYRGDDVIDPEYRYGDSGGLGHRVGEKAGEIKDRIAEAGSEAKDRVASASESVRDRVTHVGENLRDRAPGGHSEHGGPDLGERAHEMRARAEGRMRDAREQARHRGSQLEDGFRSILEDYPLALGAVSFGLGLAMGASAPTTRTEDELMGDTADTFKDEVRNTARETRDQVREVATETVRAAKSEAQREGIGADLREKAERVAKAASDTAREESRAQGLTGDQMKERAREVGERTTGHS